jgi:hypothetical protein
MQGQIAVQGSAIDENKNKAGKGSQRWEVDDYHE